MNDFMALLSSHGAAVVFLATLAARLGAPVPAVPFLVVAGGLSVGGQVSLAGPVLGAVLGNLLGDGAWFLAGRRWGYRVLRLLCRVSLSADACVQRSEALLGRWGGLSLVAAKFVPGVSVVAPPMAGALGMSNARFLGYETAGALIWTLGFLLLGRLFHTAIHELLALLSTIGLTAVLFGAAVLGLWAAWRYRLRRTALRADGIARIDIDRLRQALAGADGPALIDVRGAAARAVDGRAIPGAIGIELARLPGGLGPLADGRELVVFCDCPGDASAIAAARILHGAGLVRVRVLAGGLAAWTAAQAVDPARPAPATA